MEKIYFVLWPKFPQLISELFLGKNVRNWFKNTANAKLENLKTNGTLGRIHRSFCLGTGEKLSLDLA